MVRPSRRTFVIEHLRSFNLFSSYPSSTNDYDIQNELLSTRVFLLLLILCIAVLGIYTSQENITETITVNEPNFNRFRALIQAYPNTLKCPCENIAITQNTFISLHPDFHHLCTSDFVSRNWSAHITATADAYVSKDFSYVGGPFFQALAAFCDLAKAHLNNALLTFNSTRFISTTALAENSFMQRVQLVTDAFETNTIGTFIQPFNVIRETTYSNSLMSGLFTNANVTVHPVFLLAGIYFESYNKGACHCYLTPTCIEPLTRQVKNSSTIFTIPGLYIGCYLVEAMRSSSLECFYNQSCLNQVESFLSSPTPFNATVLDASLSNFTVNSTIDTLLSQAMIERWNQDVSWSNYYERCKPATCTYSFATKYNFWYIVTTIIGLIGGLIKVMRIAIPRAIKFIRRRICGAIPSTLPESTIVPEGRPFLNIRNRSRFQSRILDRRTDGETGKNFVYHLTDLLLPVKGIVSRYSSIRFSLP